MKKIAIFGAGGFGREVKWLIDDINEKKPAWNFIGYFDDDLSKIKNIELKMLLGGTDELNAWKEDISLVFAIGNPVVKRKIIQKIKNPVINYPVLVHPNVYMSKNNVEIGEGTIICASTLITVDIKIGKHVIVNLCCTIGHDTMIAHSCLQ